MRQRLQIICMKIFLVIENKEMDIQQRKKWSLGRLNFQDGLCILEDCRNNPMVRKELMMQRSEEEGNFLVQVREWDHKWRDLLLIRAGKNCGGRDGALITITCQTYTELGIYLKLNKYLLSGPSKHPLQACETKQAAGPKKE